MARPDVRTSTRVGAPGWKRWYSTRPWGPRPTPTRSFQSCRGSAGRHATVKRQGDTPQAAGGPATRDRRRVASNRQQAAGSRGQAEGGKRQAASGRQQAGGGRQQAGGGRSQPEGGPERTRRWWSSWQVGNRGAETNRNPFIHIDVKVSDSREEAPPRTLHAPAPARPQQQAVPRRLEPAAELAPPTLLAILHHPPKHSPQTPPFPHPTSNRKTCATRRQYKREGGTRTMSWLAGAAAPEALLLPSRRPSGDGRQAVPAGAAPPRPGGCTLHLSGGRRRAGRLPSWQKNR